MKIKQSVAAERRRRRQTTCCLFHFGTCDSNSWHDLIESNLTDTWDDVSLAADVRSSNYFENLLTGSRKELHKTSSQTLINIFHHFLTKRLIKNILNWSIDNKIIFRCSRGTFLTVLCDKFSVMYVYVINSDHFSSSDVKITSRLCVIPPDCDFCFFYNVFKMIVITLTLGAPRWSSRRSRANIVNTTTRHASRGEPGFTSLFDPSTSLHGMCLNLFFHQPFLLFDKSFCWTLNTL